MNMLLKRFNNIFWKWFVFKEVGRDFGYLIVILVKKDSYVSYVV